MIKKLKKLLVFAGASMAGIIAGLLIGCVCSYGMIVLAASYEQSSFWKLDGTDLKPYVDDWDVVMGNITIGGVTNGDIDMGNDVIINIGNAGTDFDSNGGLTLADDFSCVNATNTGSLFVQQTASTSELFVQNNGRIGGDLLVGGNATTGHLYVEELLLGTTLDVPSGGTGATSLTDYGVLVGSGTDPITALAVGTNGQILVGSTGADPVFATFNCDDDLTCTTGAGSLEIDVDDSFLRNDADDSTAYSLSMKNGTTTGSFYITKDGYVAVDFTVAGNTSLVNATTSGSLYITKDSRIAQSLTVDGDTSLANGTTTGSWVIQGTASTTEFFVQNSAHIGVDLSIDGALTVGSTASSTGGFNTLAGLHVGGNGEIEGTLSLPALATPAGTFIAIDGNGDVIATTSPSGITTSGSDNELLTDDGAGGINSESTLTYDGSTLGISGNISLTGTDNILGANSMDIYTTGPGDDILIDPNSGGAASLNLGVSGDGDIITMYGTTRIQELNATSTETDLLVVNGNATTTGSHYVGGTASTSELFVQADGRIGGNLLVGGNATTASLYVTDLNINNAYELPTSDGTDGQVLTTDGSGAVTWGDVSSNPISGIDDYTVYLADSTLNDSTYCDGGGDVFTQFDIITITAGATDKWCSAGGTAGVIDISTDFEATMRVKMATGDSYDHMLLGLFDTNGSNYPTGSAWVENHAGFIIDGTSVYASNADDTTQTATEVTGITTTNWNSYRVKRVSSNIYFYVNGTLEATHTTNLPDNEAVEIMFRQSCGNAGGGARTGYVNGFIFAQ